MKSSTGDVYLFVAEKDRPRFAVIVKEAGPFLECVARSTIFDYWANLPPHRQSQISLEENAHDLPYFDIKHHWGFGSKCDGEDVVGFFIPCDTNKAIIADDLRRRFGPGTVLVKTLITTRADDNLRHLAWIKAKHRSNDPKLVEQIVCECAGKFARLDISTTDKRAEIYMAVRAKLQHESDARLVKHAHVRCNS